MSETVFVFGAGASAESQAPTVLEFLDAADRLLRTGRLDERHDRPRFELVARGRAALDAVFAKSWLDSNDLEAVFGAFEMAALFEQPLGSLKTEEVKELPGAMRHVIVRTLEELVEFQVLNANTGDVLAPPRQYKQFLDIVEGLHESREPFSLITFNYDLGLDYALLSAGFGVDYGLPGPPLPGDGRKPNVPLLKLHGSLNWVPCKAKDCIKIAPAGLKDFAKRSTENPEKTKHLRVSHASHHCPHCGSGDVGVPRPVIVPPTWNKRHDGVATVWRRAAHHLRHASRIVVIGYSLPPTDQFFRYLYALGSVGEVRLLKFLVMNPDASVEQRFKDLLGRGVERSFMFRQWRFGTGMMSLASHILKGGPWKPEVEPGL